MKTILYKLFCYAFIGATLLACSDAIDDNAQVNTINGTYTGNISAIVENTNYDTTNLTQSFSVYDSADNTYLRAYFSVMRSGEQIIVPLKIQLSNIEMSDGEVVRESYHASARLIQGYVFNIPSTTIETEVTHFQLTGNMETILVEDIAYGGYQGFLSKSSSHRPHIALHLTGTAGGLGLSVVPIRIVISGDR